MEYVIMSRGTQQYVGSSEKAQILMGVQTAIVLCKMGLSEQSEAKQPLRKDKGGLLLVAIISLAVCTEPDIPMQSLATDTQTDTRTDSEGSCVSGDSCPGSVTEELPAGVNSGAGHFDEQKNIEDSKKLLEPDSASLLSEKIDTRNTHLASEAGVTANNKVDNEDSKVEAVDDPKQTVPAGESKEIGSVEDNKESGSVEDTKETGSPDETKTIDRADDSKANASLLDSTVWKWLRYLIDPVLEEFKDGMYANATEASNKSIVSSNLSESIEKDVNNISTNADLSTSVNITEPQAINISSNASAQNESDTGRKVKFQCSGRNVTENTTAEVKLVNSTRLLQILSFDKNETENVTDCVVVMFFAPWCHFCAKTAPHYNALARAFPQLDVVAVDTAQFSNLLARFGTVSVPNVLIFHQSRSAIKFNQTERTFENFVAFVRNTTGLEANTTVNVTETDYLGPISSVPTDDPDYLLWLSWVFVTLCGSYMFIKSNRGQQWINMVGVLWQEHQHID